MAVDELDADHRRALELMNDLQDRIIDADRHGGLLLLKGLISHDRRHFLREERMLAACGFPGLAAHAEGHRDAERVLLALKAHMTDGHWTGVERVFEDVCTDFVGLIAADIEYKWFLIDRRVRPRFAGTEVRDWEKRAPPMISAGYDFTPS